MSTMESLTVKDLRNAARHFAPEARGAGGLAHTGNKEQLIALLQEKGVMPGEVDEFLKGNEKIEAPAPAPLPYRDDAFEKAAKDAFIKAMMDSGEAENNEPESSDELELIRKIITKNVKSEIDPEKINQIIDQKFDEFRKSTVKVIEVKQADELPNKVIGTCHKLTEQIAQVCNLGIHQMLVGPGWRRQDHLLREGRGNPEPEILSDERWTADHEKRLARFHRCRWQLPHDTASRSL